MAVLDAKNRANLALEPLGYEVGQVESLSLNDDFVNDGGFKPFLVSDDSYGLFAGSKTIEMSVSATFDLVKVASI